MARVTSDVVTHITALNAQVMLLPEHVLVLVVLVVLVDLIIAVVVAVVLVHLTVCSSNRRSTVAATVHASNLLLVAMLRQITIGMISNDFNYQSVAVTT
jgi:hypothetical protein